MSEFFVINGWFKQDGIRIDTNPSSTIVGLYSSDNARYMFQGVVRMENDETFSGSMIDQCGAAAIDGRIKSGKLTFEKEYLHREDAIHYELDILKKPGQNFKGHYQGKKVGKGEAFVVLTPLPEEFFG